VKNYLGNVDFYHFYIKYIDNVIKKSIITINAKKRKVALRILLQRVSIGERKQRILK